MVKKIWQPDITTRAISRRTFVKAATTIPVAGGLAASSLFLESPLAHAQTTPSQATNTHLDVYVRGSDSAVWHKSFDNNAWGEWESLGGRIESTPAAVSWSPGRRDVFGTYKGDLHAHLV